MKKPHTLQQLERTESASETHARSDAPIERDEAWVDSYDTQATDALYAKATRYASARAAQIVAAGGGANDAYIEDVVQSAFADTYTGTLTWDPSKASLETHVILAIKGRTRHDRDRIGERRDRSFDLHEPSRVRADVEASLAAECEHRDRARATAEGALAALRAIATDERADDVLALLDAFDNGAYSRAAVLRTTVLTPKRYRNARARLATFTKRLPADIQRAVRRRA